MSQVLNTVSIDWDIDANTKRNIFADTIHIYESGDLQFSLNEDPYCFYEVDALIEVDAYIKEAYNNSALNEDNVCKPFLFIRNIGLCKINFYAAHSGINDFWSFTGDKKTIDAKYCNYIINPKEALLLTICSAEDGVKYVSSATYPFGFYYDFNNVSQINKLGEYPVCKTNFSLCSYSLTGGIDYYPSFTYEDIYNIDSRFSQNANSNICLEYSPIHRYSCNPTGNGLVSARFNVDDFLITKSSGKLDLSVHTGNFYFSTWIKPQKYPNYGNVSVPFTLYSCYNDNTGCVAYTGYYNLNFDLLRIKDDGTISAGITGQNICRCINYCNYFTCDKMLQIPLCNCSDLCDSNNYITGFCDVDGNCVFNLNFKIKPNAIIDSGKQFIFSNGVIHLYLTDFNTQDSKVELNICNNYGQVISNTGLYICTEKYGCYLFEQRYIGGYFRFAYRTDSNSNPVYEKYECIWSSGYQDKAINRFYIGAEDYISGSYINPFSGILQDIQYVIFDPNDLDASVRTFYALNGANTACTNSEYCMLDENNNYIYCNCDFYYNSCYLDERNLNTLKNEVEVIPSKIKYTGKIDLNSWTHYELCFKQTGCCVATGYMKINDQIVNSGCLLLPFLNNTGNAVELCVSSKWNNSEDYFGLISDTKFCRTGLSLLDINFDWREKSFTKIKSYGFNSYVDSGVNLNISLYKNNDQISCCLNPISKIGGNCHSGKINIKSIYLINDSGCELITDFSNYNFCDVINSNRSYCLIYDIETSSKFIKNYLYKYSGNSAYTGHKLFYYNSYESNLICDNILPNSGSIVCYTGKNNSNIYKIETCDDFNICVELNLNNCLSIKDLRNENLQRNNLYLPLSCDLYNLYLFKLSDVNKDSVNNCSGNWVSSGCFENLNNCLFVNYTTIVDCDSLLFSQNKPIIEYLNFKYCDNKVCTFSIDQKDKNSTSENYQLVLSSTEQSFIYNDLEFKYKPVAYLSYNNQRYELPGNCLIFTNCINSTCLQFAYPVNGLTYQNLSLISNYEISEKIKNSDLNIDFGYLIYCCNNKLNNEICYKYAKIRCENLSGYISPNLLINNQYSYLIQKNISYYADPFKNFDIYSNYDLNNLLLFITSKINGGIASCCECFSGLVYGSSDYNFFMLDLQNEFIECNYKTPSGCGPILFDERIIFTNCALLNPLSYRTKNGCCYNYIIPVSHNLCLTYSGNNFLESKNINSNLNCKKINLRFCAGEFDFFSLYDIGNFITGSGSGYLNNSYLYSFNNTNSIYINNCSLQSISGNKNLSICKSYYFTGVQPIYIESNYPLLDLKSPIKNIYLNEYEYSDLAPSGIYYYTYNLANITKHNIRFSSPEMTKINTISWKDASQEARGVSILNKNLSGKIQDNVAIINFDITGALSCNSYYYDSGIYYICINIVGGL